MSWLFKLVIADEDDEGDMVVQAMKESSIKKGEGLLVVSVEFMKRGSLCCGLWPKLPELPVAKAVIEERELQDPQPQTHDPKCEHRCQHADKFGFVLALILNCLTIQ